MFKKIIKFGILAVVVLVIVYFGVTLYANFTGGTSSQAGAIKLPKVEEATYSVLINNTGNLLFTSNYEMFGKVYVLHGFWEMSGPGYTFRNRNLSLDPGIFGTITVKPRVAVPSPTVRK